MAAKVSDGAMNIRYFLKGINGFGKPTLTEVPVDDLLSFYMGYFLRRHYQIDNSVNKRSLSEGGGNSKSP